MIEEEKFPTIFPQLNNEFITRLIFEYIPHKQLYGKICYLNKKAQALAMDCSILKQIVYGKQRDNMSYDCYDWFETFLAKLTKREELQKLDFHYFFRGEQLERNVLKQLPNFYNLRDLRFGEHHFSNFNLFHFKKLDLKKVEHITIPLYAFPDKAEEFFKAMETVAPNVNSMTFEDPSFDRESCTEQCATRLAQLGIRHLRFKLHEKSSPETMKAFIKDLYPQLESLYITCVQPALHPHEELMEDLLRENGKLKKLKMKCDGTIPKYYVGFKVSTLEDVYISRLTTDYESLTQFLFMNQNLKRFKMKHPTKMEKVHDPCDFHFNQFKQLNYLSIAGEFKLIHLSKLPLLEYLQIKFQWARVKLICYPKLRMNLETLEAFCDYDQKLIVMKKLEVEWKNLKVAHFKETDSKQKYYLPEIEQLRTSEPQLIPPMEMNPMLLRLTYLYPAFIEEYIEEFLHNIKAIPNLRYLRIDGTLRQERSLGQIRLSHPKLTTFCVRSVDKADDQIQITNKCVCLRDFELLCTNSKKIRIDAPNIQRVLLDGYCDYKPEDLVITAETGYSLILTRGGVHIENCHGVGKLVIESNWANNGEYLSTELTKKDYYPLLSHISCYNLGVYSNKFFHSFATTAPILEELFIAFNEVLILEDEKAGDGIIDIKHPALKWVTLLEGNAFFDGIRLNKESKNLRLVKFRDFELDEFYNDGDFKFQSEKNLLNDKDFF